ncbi:hypothetical protein [Streptomyces sp. SM14]|uniref:hypothetical protein n=1 Tax=Streptomyces sp. SM14 TaxID=1736045 RepID=UPI0011B079C3|nr:hypothetical protein [Streptomyces sp. SM14]
MDDRGVDGVEAGAAVAEDGVRGLHAGGVVLAVLEVVAEVKFGAVGVLGVLGVLFGVGIVLRRAPVRPRDRGVG